jgi:hypothetical protein
MLLLTAVFVEFLDYRGIAHHDAVVADGAR